MPRKPKQNNAVFHLQKKETAAKPKSTTPKKDAKTIVVQPATLAVLQQILLLQKLKNHLWNSIYFHSKRKISSTKALHFLLV